MNDVLNGRFTIIETVSEDRLYKAVDTATGQMAAVKKWVNGDSYFEAELEALTSLKHLNVPQIICSFEEDGCKYIAEKWLDGEPPKKLSTSKDTVNIAVKIAEFISAMNSSQCPSRIHGDIKPSNLIVNNGKVYFIDFECSVVTEEVKRKSKDTFKVIGRYFTAPEVFYGRQCIQSDIYSVGAVMAWMMGGVDDDGLNLSRIAADSRLKAIIKKCLSYKIESRYVSAEELIYDLKLINSKTDINISLTKNFCRESFSVFVDCNVFFAWEMAVAATSYFGMKACVLAVTDRTQRKINYFSDINRTYGTQNVKEEAIPCYFSAASLFKRDASSWLAKGLIKNTSEAGERMFYSEARFPGEAEPENEEYIKDLIKWGKENFDCVIFVTDRYDDKPAVKNFAAECDYTIATPLANVDDIEACKDYYECFGGRVLYVAWEFSRESSLPEESIRLIVGEDNYLGAILRSDEKNFKRNFAGKIQPIFMAEGKEEQAGYVQIINRLFRVRNFKKGRV